MKDHILCQPETLAKDYPFIAPWRDTERIHSLLRGSRNDQACVKPTNPSVFPRVAAFSALHTFHGFRLLNHSSPAPLRDLEKESY